MHSLRLCVFLAFIAVLRCYELSQNLSEFYCVFNGNYSNKEQVENDGGGHTPIDIIMQSVYAPALSEVPVLYFQVAMAGALLKSTVGIVTQGDDGTIFMQQHNFTGNRDIAPGTVNTKKFKFLRPDDLQGLEDCQDAFVYIKPLTFAGNWQDCMQAPVDGIRGSYVSTNTCNEFVVVIPVGAPENATLVPYMINRQGHKYPLENAPAKYVCNCDTTGDRLGQGDGTRY